MIARANAVLGIAITSHSRGAGRDPLESFAMTEEKHKPKLATPSMVALIQGARPGVALTDADRDAPIDRCASRLRSELTGSSVTRRQHRGHAALLIASCVAFAPKKRAAELLRWAMDLRQQYWRRHAFREELARACESLGVLVSA